VLRAVLTAAMPRPVTVAVGRGEAGLVAVGAAVGQEVVAAAAAAGGLAVEKRGAAAAAAAAVVAVLAGAMVAEAADVAPALREAPRAAAGPVAAADPPPRANAKALVALADDPGASRLLLPRHVHGVEAHSEDQRALEEMVVSYGAAGAWFHVSAVVVRANGWCCYVRTLYVTCRQGTAS
jgi:hypothetical protein